MGISGICDIVEFHETKDGVPISKFGGAYTVFPIEYKRGKTKEHDADALQLVAQAMCLEEMLECHIEKGAIYYGQTKRRQEIVVTDAYREEVRKISEEMHQYYDRGYTPKVKKSKACGLCSLKELCLPSLERTMRVDRYVEMHIGEES